MTCPWCGEPLTKQHGAIEEACLSSVARTAGQVIRVVRPVVFWACGTCEFCEEVRP
jgi:hypothetical protein